MKKFILLLFFVSIISLFLSSFLYLNYTSSFKKITYSAFVTFSEEVNGFDVNSTALTFGSIVPLGSSRRQVSVKNPYPFPIIVNSEFSGSITPFLIDIEPTIILPFNETSIPVTVFMDINKNFSFGEYSGNVTFILKRLIN